ncbi:unnamed protein product, partial [Musa acuminata var. zebrina]
EHNAGGLAAQVWSRATWSRGAQRRRAGRAGVVSGNMRPRSTTQAGWPRRCGLG